MNCKEIGAANSNSILVKEKPNIILTPIDLKKRIIYCFLYQYLLGKAPPFFKLLQIKPFEILAVKDLVQILKIKQEDLLAKLYCILKNKL